MGMYADVPYIENLAWLCLSAVTIQKLKPAPAGFFLPFSYFHALMNKQIKSALVSVFYKDGLEPIVRKLHQLGVVIYSTGGTQQFIEGLGLPCIPVEDLTSYPSILGGRVKDPSSIGFWRHPR